MATTKKLNVLEVVEPNTRNFVEWTPDSLRIARLSAAGGNLKLAADLCNDFHGDDRIPGALETRIKGLLGLPFSFAPADGAKRRTPIVKAAETDWVKANPEDQLYNLMMWGILLGVGLGEIIPTESKDGRLLPRLKTWNPRWLRWDFTSRSWKLQTEGGDVDITPGDGKWILYTPYGPSRPWERGKWLSLSLWWLAKRFAVTDWSRYGEKHGSPITAGTMPDNKAGDKQARKDLAADLDNLGANASVALPPGYDLKLVEATANTWGTFQAQINMANSGIAIAINGQNLTTEVKEGSRAAATVHEAVKQDLIEADAETASTTLHEQSWTWWATWNYGDARLTPWPQWDTTPPEDRTKTAETLSKISPQLDTLERHGVDVKALLERYGLPMMQDVTQQKRSVMQLLSGADPSTKPSAREFLNGQLYADRIADQAIRLGRDLHRADLDRVLTAALSGTDFESIRRKLLEVYDDLSPDEIAEKTEQALILSEFAGRYAARDG
jgi:phage gp29-like protein